LIAISQILAAEKIIRRIEDRLARSARQFRGLTDRPQQNAGIEEQAHQRPSNAAVTSAGNGASKSAGILIRTAGESTTTAAARLICGGLAV
jgi:hypothetical protein